MQLTAASRLRHAISLSAALLVAALTLNLAVPVVAAASSGATYKGFYAGYCTPYAARQFDKVAPAPRVNWRGNAGQWYDSAHRAGWKVTKNPKLAEPGSVIVWTRAGRAGHVGVVRKVTSKYVYIEEMNWKGRFRTSTARLPISNLNRTNYRFKGFVIPERKAAAKLRAPALPAVRITEYVQIPILREMELTSASIASVDTTTVAVASSVPGIEARLGKATPFTATVAPGYLAKGSTASKMVFERYQGGKWVRQFTKSATVTTSSSRTDDVVARVALQKTGKWRVRAHTPGNGIYRAQKTAWSYFRVR